ncbi:hypothetical protein ACW9UR_19305 [Halovulum sp. GXIMD14794]
MDTEHEASHAMHPLATHHLPMFVPGPDESDWLMTSMGVFLILAIIGIGVFYLKLHALPEHMAHRGQKLQYEIVAVLALIALFTHNHIFWIAGLLLALVPLPDFTTPLTSMARSLGKMAGEPEPPAEDNTPTAGASNEAPTEMRGA